MGYPSPGMAWYSVSVLMLMYIFSFIDRQIIALLVEPMKRDLHITDTQIGLLQGLAFALLYTFLGLPIARLADRLSRKGLIAGGIMIWSLMATLCGFARSAGTLFLARVGVGVGEATLSPAAYSIITDSFPRSKLGSAFAVYNIGIPIGAGIALLVGGSVVGALSAAGESYVLPLVGAVRAWQLVFIVTGAPGMLLPLLLLTFAEPKRRGLLVRPGQENANPAPLHPPVRKVLLYVWSNRAFYGLHFCAMGFLAMAGYAVSAWLPTALIRNYPVTSGSVGKVIGLCTLCVSASGLLLAGKLCDRLTRRGLIDAAIIVARIAAFGIAGLSSFPAFMPSVPCVWAAVFVACVPLNAYNGVGPMAVNQVTPNQFRAQVSAVYLLVVNLLGLGLGPTLVPFINDHYFHDPAAIRYSLALVVISSSAIAATLLTLVRPIYRRKQRELAAGQL